MNIACEAGIYIVSYSHEYVSHYAGMVCILGVFWCKLIVTMQMNFTTALQIC